MANLFYINVCTSTNDEIEKYFLGNKDLRYIALYTFNQTLGRGQYGNRWDCEENLNIAFSFAFATDTIGLPLESINYHTAVICRDFIANLTKNEVKIKWPNDFIIKNKKIAGMILEKKTILNKEYWVLGLGINVLQKDFINLPNAGSIVSQTGIVMDLHTVSNLLFKYLSTHYFTKTTSEKVLEWYNLFLYKKNEISVFELNGLRQNGIIRHADSEGYLWIDLENDGVTKFFYKEIKMCY